MRIALITPARPGSRAGNRHTALRWAAMLRAAGHRVTVSTEWEPNDEDDLLLALHARRSHASIRKFKDLHPDRPDQRGVLLPSGTMIMLPEEPTFAAIEAAGGRVATHADAHLLGEGFLFASGLIERVTDYETGLVGHHTFRGDKGEADPLILDERFVAARVRGRGVTVLSACSHAGVVNACLGAQTAFAESPIDVVLGGFHLSGKAMESRIPATVGDLVERIRPRVIAPGHCTGWRAKTALAQAFAPSRYAPSVVGALYVLKAPGSR